MPSGRRTHLSATPPAVRQAADALDAFCADERLPEAVAWRLRVAIDEIVANIVAYGTVDGRRPDIEVVFRREGNMVEIVVADTGPAFDPLARAAPDVTLPLESRQPGGLGIALVRSLIDDVQYARTTQNVLTLRTKIVPDEPPGGTAIP